MLLASSVRACLLLLLLLPARGHLPLLLHLTDLHVSSLSPSVDVTRSPDLHNFATLLPHWQLDAIVITGDLTDAKTQGGRGQQQEQEWKEYQEIWRDLAHHAGLPSSLLLDLRGNHDVFDILRGGRSDLFTRYSARAEAAAASCHEGLHAASQAAQEQGAPASRARAATSCGPCAGCGRVYIDELPAQPPSGSPAGGSASEQDGAGSNVSCPHVVLLGLDATPDPGFRSPTNFLGVVEPSLLHEAEARLQQLHSSLSSRGCRPQLLAYGHYPLSTTSTIGYPAVGSQGSHHPQGCVCDGPAETKDLDKPDTPAQQHAAAVEGSRGEQARAAGPDSMAACPGACKPRSATLEPSVSLPSSIRPLLARYNVSMFLCGHLHDAFGTRLHKMHGQRASSKGSFLAELELPDWKYSRHFRLLTFDQQAGTSFTDLTFRRNAAGGSQPQVGSLDRSRKLDEFIVLITSPPDARYFPLHSLSSHEPPPQGPSLRALLLPLHNTTRSPAQPPRVTGLLTCGSSSGAWGQGQPTVQRFPLLPVPSDPGVFEALLPLQAEAAACLGQSWVQVEVQQPPGPGGAAGEAGMSTSELRAIPGSWLMGNGGKAGVQPAPMGSTWLEWIVLTTDWPTCATWAFRVQWLLLFGLMLVQPFPCSRQASSEESSPRRHQSQLLKGISEESELQSLLWWFRGWLMYLMLGPWLLACIGSAGGDRGTGACPWPPGVLTAHGIYFTDSSGAWKLSTTQDMAMVTAIHMAASVVPGTLWMLWLVRGWQAAGHTLLRYPGSSITRWMSWKQVVALLILLWLHGIVLAKLYVGFGALSILVSPGMGWVVPLGAAWLSIAYRRLQQQRAVAFVQENS